MGWLFSQGEKAQPKEESFYDDSHPTQARTPELEAVNEAMVERHHQAMRMVNGCEWPSLEEIEQDGKELNQTIKDMRAKGYELDVPGMNEPDRPWQFYRR